MKITRYVCDVDGCQRDAVARLTAATLPNSPYQTSIGYAEMSWPGTSRGMDLCEPHFERAQLVDGSIIVRFEAAAS